MSKCHTYIAPELLCECNGHTMCHWCGAVNDTKLVGGVVVCKRCDTFWDKDTCEQLSKREAIIRMCEGD